MTVLRFVGPDGGTLTGIHWTGDDAAEVIAEMGADLFAPGDRGTAMFRPYLGAAWRDVRVGEWLVLQRHGWERMAPEAFRAISIETEEEGLEP